MGRTILILIKMARNFTERIAPMAQKNSMIRQAPLLTFGLFFTLAFQVCSQIAIAQTGTAEEPVTIVLKDFDVHPNITQAKAGRLTLEAVNKGKSIHELVILKTDLNPAALPRKEAKPQPGRVTEYLVNEDDARIETIDEIEEFPAGTSQKKTIVLGPGHYVLFCNIPGHYDKGMYASLHVSR
jgi:uncharacterized cupredoxin-like copper-binding protein